MIKFGYSEKATKFEKIFHLKFDATKKKRGFINRSGHLLKVTEIQGGISFRSFPQKGGIVDEAANWQFVIPYFKEMTKF